MKKISKNKILVAIVCAIAFLIALTTKSSAATASISCNSTANVNEPISISVTGSAVQWNLKLYVDGELIASSSEFENYEANKNISFSGTYTPTSAGSKNVTLTGSITEFSDKSTTTSFASRAIKVTAIEEKPEETPNEPSTDDQNQNTSNNDNSNNTGDNNTSNQSPETNTNTQTPPVVEEPQQKLSNDANLKNLGITPNEYDFKGFRKAITSYSCSVPNEASEIKIYAEASNSKSKVEGTGLQKLNEGKNSFEIKVTAEDGTTKVYTLNIERLAKTEETPQEEDKEEEKTDENTANTGNKLDLNTCLTKLSIAGYTINPQFKANIYDYKIDVKDDIDKLNIQAVANSGLETEIVGNEKLKEGENTITILVTNPETNEIATYQITVNKAVEKNAGIANEETSKNTRAWILCGIIVLVLVVLIISFMIKLKNMPGKDKPKKQRSYEIEDDDIDNRTFESDLDENEDDENLQFKTAKSSFIKVTDFVSATEFAKKEDCESEEKEEEKRDLEALLSKTKKGGRHF